MSRVFLCSFDHRPRSLLVEAACGGMSGREETLETSRLTHGKTVMHLANAKQIKGTDTTMLAIDIDFGSSITQAFTDLASFIPKLIAFLLILVIGTFVAKWIRKLIVGLLNRIRFDSYIDKAGIGAPLERAGFADSGRFVAQLIYFMIMLMVLQLALSAFGPNDISALLEDLVAFIPKLIVAIAIIIVTGMVANAVGDMIRPGLADVAAGPLLSKVAVGAIWMIGVFAALDQVEFAADIVDTLFTAIIGSLSAIIIIKFGVGGIWAARDRFWPNAYDKISGANDPQA